MVRCHRRAADKVSLFLFSPVSHFTDFGMQPNHWLRSMQKRLARLLVELVLQRRLSNAVKSSKGVRKSWKETCRVVDLGEKRKVLNSPGV